MSSDQVLDRIAERDTARRQKIADAAASRQNEGNADLESIRFEVTTLQSAAEEALRAATTQPALKGRLDLQAASVTLKKLQQRLLESAWLLPTHELRQYQSATEKLQEQVSAEVAKVRPRKVFSLTSKPRSSPAAAAAALEALAKKADSAAQLTNTAQISTVAGPKPRNPTASPSNTESLIRGISGEKLVKRAGSMTEGEFCVSDLVDCTVLLLAPCSTLRLQRLSRCTVAAGPISGAAFLDDLVDCKVVLATHQYRCHTSRDVITWLQVSSNPIIENCSDMVFTGLTPHHESVLLRGNPAEADSDKAPAPPSGGAATSQNPVSPLSSSQTSDCTAAAATTKAWAGVQDFNHVHSAVSPNWRFANDAECQQAPRLAA